MNVTVLTTRKGNTVRIYDPISPGTPEWEVRQKRIEKACARFWIAMERERNRGSGGPKAEDRNGVCAILAEGDEAK